MTDAGITSQSVGYATVFNHACTFITAKLEIAKKKSTTIMGAYRDVLLWVTKLPFDELNAGTGPGLGRPEFTDVSAESSQKFTQSSRRCTCRRRVCCN